MKRDGIRLIVMTGDGGVTTGRACRRREYDVDARAGRCACGLPAPGIRFHTRRLRGNPSTRKALGRRPLVGVKDVMSPLALPPVIQPGGSIKEALFEITKGTMGFVVVVEATERPASVLTDGDLRRCLDRDVDLRSTDIAGVMTTHFTSIRDDQLAVAPVDLMEKHKVSALPVLDESDRLVGAVNMRQLLQAGVV